MASSNESKTTRSLAFSSGHREIACVMMLCLCYAFLPLVCANPIPTFPTYGDEHLVDTCNPDSCHVDEYCLDHGSGITLCYSCTTVCPGYPPPPAEVGNEDASSSVTPVPTPSFSCREKCPRYIKQFEKADEPSPVAPDTVHVRSSSGFLGETAEDIILVTVAVIVVILVLAVAYLLLKSCKSPKETAVGTTGNGKDKTNHVRDNSTQNGHIPNGHITNVNTSNGHIPNSGTANGRLANGNIANGGMHISDQVGRRGRGSNSENREIEEAHPLIEHHTQSASSHRGEGNRPPVLVTQPTNSAPSEK